MNIPIVTKRKLQKGKSQKNTIKILTPPHFPKWLFPWPFKIAAAEKVGLYTDPSKQI